MKRCQKTFEPLLKKDFFSFFSDDTRPLIGVIRQLSLKNKVKVYGVGGFLRDSLLSRPCLDFDFAVEKNALKFSRAFAQKIHGAYVLLDEDRGCARVVKKISNTILTFDFADFRGKNLKSDLKQRDFTINTLCVDVQDFKEGVCLSEILVDFQGGLKDLALKKIRMVSQQSFRDDPLRLIRAFSLFAQLGFQIDSKTLGQIKKNRSYLQGVAYERIRDELFKILSSGRTFSAFQVMDKVGLLEKVIPQIRIMYRVHQGGYHHLDVWKHSLETVKQLEGILQEVTQNVLMNDYLHVCLAGNRCRLALMKLAALLHDIGKPAAKRRKDTRTVFYGHERLGKDIVRKISEMLKLSKEERFALEDMVLWHLRPGYLANFKFPTARSVFRYFRDTKQEALSILLLSWADQRSTRGRLTTKAHIVHHEKIVRRLMVDYLENSQKKIPPRLLTGDDLIKKLHLTPSPVFAKILRQVEEQQALGLIQTKDAALALAQTIVKNLSSSEKQLLIPVRKRK